MSWPAKTWVPDELVTAAALNQWLRDPLADLSGHAHSGAAGQGAAALAPTTITMGGALYQRRGADVTAAAALSIGADGNYFNVVGATGISSITTRAAGTVIILRLNSALTVTHGGGITLQGATNWAAPAGAMLQLVSHGSNDWREVSRHTLGATVAMGYLWLEPSTISGGDAQAARVSGNPPTFGTAQASATWGLVIPTDMTTMVVATVYRVGSTASLLGAFSTLTPGAMATVTDTPGVGSSWYGLLVQWR